MFFPHILLFSMYHTYVSLWDPESMKFSHVLERSPQDWETTMHQNAVLAFFHTQNICHGAWKILRTTLCCFVFLQSRGEGLKSKENYGTKFSLLFKPSPRDWRKTKQQSVVLRIFHAPWHIFCVWKNARTTFWCIVVSQSRGDRSKTSWTQDLRVKHK